MDLMKKAGSIDYAKEVAEELVEDAFKEVDQVMDNKEANKKFKAFIS